MSTSSPPSTPPLAPLPIPISTSTLLSTLPPSSTAALTKLSHPSPTISKQKILVRFKPVGSAPPLSRAVWKIEAGKPFSKVVSCLREQLGRRGGLGMAAAAGAGAGTEVFAYVNTFAPGLDEEVGMLYEVDNQLVVSYSLGVAFG